MQAMNTRIKWLGVLGILASGCGDRGSLGYSSDPRCQGEATRCVAPENIEPVATEDTGLVPIHADLAALDPEWTLPADCGGAPLVGGAGSTVWLFCLTETGVRARQFDASGHLGDLDLAAPAGIVSQDGSVSTALFMSKTSTPKGPLVGLNWSMKCEDPDLIPCSYRELVQFANDPATQPVRTRLDAEVPEADFISLPAIPGDASDYFVLGQDSLNWSVARVGTQGELLWMQQAFPEDFTPVSATMRGPIARHGNGLTVLGRLAESQLVLVDVDGPTGNLSARLVTYGADDDAKLVQDAKDRAHVLYTDDATNLHWVRLDAAGASTVTLVRTDYTLLAPADLDADAAGNAYATTVSGPLGKQVLTVCRMGDALDVTCHQLPGAFIGNIPGVGGVAFLPGFAWVSASDDGSLYTIGSDLASIQRYRFPDTALQ